jgi:hypothetical protein
MRQAQLDDLVGPGTLSELSKKLCALPEAKFLAVVEQLNPYSDVPAVAQLIDACRPRLRQLRPARPSSLKRLFSVPFEDLLASSSPADGLAPLSIPRAAIRPCWEVVKHKAADEISDLDARLREIGPANAKRLLDLCERLWLVGAGVLTAVTTEPAADHPRQMLLIRDALLAAPIIERFKREVPAKPVAAIGPAEKACIVKCINELTGRRVPVIAFLLVVAARVRSPAELIELLGGTGAPVPEEIETFAVAQLVDRVNRLDDTIAISGPEALAKEIDEVLQAMAETTGVVGKALKTGLDENALGMEQAARAALDEHVIDAAPGALEAAFAIEPARDALLAAEAHARALYRSRKAAQRLGLGDKAEAIMTSMRHRFEACVQDELKAAAATGSPATSAALYRAIRMIELVAGTEAARPHLRAAINTARSC